MLLTITKLLLLSTAFISIPLALRSISLEKQFTNTSNIKGDLTYRMNTLIILQGLACFLFTLAFSLLIISEDFTAIQTVFFIAIIVEVVAITTYMIAKLKVAAHVGARDLE